MLFPPSLYGVDGTVWAFNVGAVVWGGVPHNQATTLILTNSTDCKAPFTNVMPCWESNQPNLNTDNLVLFPECLEETGFPETVSLFTISVFPKVWFTLSCCLLPLLSLLSGHISKLPTF